MKSLFVIATGSAGKIRDFAHILGTDHYEFKTLKDIGFDGDIVEDGNSFAANAIIKSSVTAQWLADRGIEATVLADDSGLEVFALNGEPGIYSARYAGGHGDDNANNDKLMAKLEGIKDRAARYFCALSYQQVIKGEDGKFSVTEPKIYEGECRGNINYAPVGDMGFGYDPLFVPNGETRTFAQMELEEKKVISHRGNAIRALYKALSSK
ncbi:XTP/dITP diphosphohydrolase [Fibrobacter sp. UWH9]|uniref:RdgB/HAM1 family non-canonical purine NTP pyrophosphatase n=1 Tax=unclassified Fibrobacter TaxID=2634177 RepID=UPI0009187FD4|nr:MULTISPECIES: RdgB/HAM1 family non-canonical purine NTP pyrophosphatase [Fibrobacter]MCQ2099684.1 RdgB/HAM1 family non-canonical purine NTP pyrophosphatase [Fibrobacter sp.]MCL4101558.1 dITP/XTP pyrophosphatase [Fibrobacter succinogenes]MDO4947074.1 RdgB/HAM1 family non-canonical purine NTP pyrophosphatase [Fibrobacter sp.]OWV07751.1 non-canonical purine NTP pyrophosphatase, RdgB/HAM1 family [Fibrobacter sp. UWH3]OWV17328.1 non-canonical purine NTP pyrophosphatase, RdgB/HAM1 family [Fibroba